MPEAKELFFVGFSQEDLSAFPAEAKRELGYNLRLVQNGEMPEDWKPMNSIGPGVYEIRVRTTEAYRVFYVAKFTDAIYVLHAFQKKTRKTSQRDLDIGSERYNDVLKETKRKKH